MVLFFPSLPADPFLGPSELHLLIISTVYGWDILTQRTVLMSLCYYHWRCVSARGRVHLSSQWPTGPQMDGASLGSMLYLGQ